MPQEIQTPEQGSGLDWLLRARRDRLAGITNGVDYELWNPETDPHIAANFSATIFRARRECKLDLLRRFDLPEEPERPIIAIISRLVAQKGYDLIRQARRRDYSKRARSSSRSAPAPESMKIFCKAGTTARRVEVGIYKGYAGEPLAHQIEAGADMFLMPSLLRAVRTESDVQHALRHRAHRARYRRTRRYRRRILIRQTARELVSSFTTTMPRRCLKKYAKPFTFMASRKRGRRFS